VAALVAALGVAWAVPAGAAQDPPTYVRASQPDGYELFGRHVKQTGATTRCSLGFQRRGSDGAYRWWGKCSGDGRPIVAIFDQTVVVASPYTWGPTTAATRSGPVVYAVGRWHQVTDAALVITKVNVSYVTGRSTGWRCLDSYIIRKGQRRPWGNPREGC
jgi:hypothetical protein